MTINSNNNSNSNNNNNYYYDYNNDNENNKNNNNNNNNNNNDDYNNNNTGMKTLPLTRFLGGTFGKCQQPLSQGKLRLFNLGWQLISEKETRGLAENLYSRLMPLTIVGWG